MSAAHPRGRSALRLTALTAVVLLLAPRAVPAQEPRREAPPPVGTPKDFTLPPRTSYALPNGLKVSFVRWGTIPKVTVRLVVYGGSANDRPDEGGLADFVGDYMQEGTTTRSADDLARAFADMGGALGINVGDELTSIGTDVLADRASDAVRLVADVVRHPRFPDSELSRLKANAVRQIAIEKSRPQTLADERFRQILYGDTPLGRPLPSAETINGFTTEQVRRFHAENFGAARARLYVVGVFDSAAVDRAVRDAFGDWMQGTPAVPLPEPKAPAGRQLALIDRPGAVQSTLFIGLHVPDPSRPDWIPLQVTNALLGGAFGSRITTNIREQKGYTYSPFGFVAAHSHDAYWAEVADVTTSVTGASIKEIFGEVDRLRSEPPSAAELRGIQNNMAGIFTLQNSSRPGLVGQLSFVDLHGLGDQYLTSYVRRVLEVTPDEVQRITRTYLQPDRMAIVVVGDRKVVEAQVAPWAPPAGTP